LKGLLYWTFASVLLAWPSLARAQQSVDYASVSGRVTDQSGASVPGADVSARQLDTNVTSVTVTGQDGRFRFPYLRIGPYEIVVRLQGFADQRKELMLTAGAAFELPLSLSLGGLDTAITVTAEATVLESARSQIAGTVSQTEMNALPLNGRNFLELALVVPGVSPTNIPSTQLFPETSAVPGTSLSVSSQRNLSNSFIVDGLSANDDAAGLSGITYGVDAVEQVQVVTSGGQAELGRALGGYVSFVTRGGTNVVRGTAYDFIRDDTLNAENSLAGTKLPMHQSQYGGSIGGPLQRDRAFYFANVEQRRLDQSGLSTIAEPNVAIINARLRGVGYGGAPVATGVFGQPMDSTNVFAKLDHVVSSRDHLGVRYALYKVDALNARGAGALNAPSASTSLDNVDQTIAVSNTLTLSARTVLETRAQFAHSDLAAPPTDPIGPAVSIAGVVTSFGTSSGSPTGRVTNMYQVVNNLSHQAGAHALRVGADVLYNDVFITYPRSIRGAYTFSSLANFLSGVYNTAGFAQTFGATDVAVTSPSFGVYAQDEWKVSGNLTLNLGLRYDLQSLDTIDTDTNNLSPRIGAAWLPFDGRGTVVRGSAGRFFDRVPLRALANALLSAGNTTDPANLRQIGVALSPTQVGAPIFPDILSAVVPSVTLPNLTTMDRQLQNAHSRQASVEVEQQLGDRTTVSAGYQYLRGLHLLMSVNQNVPTCVASGTNNGCRPNPGYANNSQYSSVGDSDYHGLHLSLVQRATDWATFRVSYTLSKSMNNLGEFFFSSPIDPLDLSKDWGRSDDDQHHRLVANGSMQLPYDLQVSGLVQAYSSLPFNITSGVTTVQGTAGRPIVNGAFIPRNAGVGTPFVNVNLRVSHSLPLGRVKLETLAEIFNVTNRQNVATRNTNFGSGTYPTNPSTTFGQVTAVGEPRSLQIGIRVRF
jgi:outer membrane receptor protein involved in Fe transport